MASVCVLFGLYQTQIQQHTTYLWVINDDLLEKHPHMIKFVTANPIVVFSLLHCGGN